jgi:hypothetical protein
MTDPIDQKFADLTTPPAEPALAPLPADPAEEAIAERFAYMLHELADAVQVGLIRIPKLLPPR